MDSSTASLLHGGIDELKSCDQGITVEDQEYIRKRPKNKCFWLRNITFLSLILNITLLLLLWGKVTKSSRSKYGRLISEQVSSMC